MEASSADTNNVLTKPGSKGLKGVYPGRAGLIACYRKYSLPYPVIVSCT